jgi:hypothetical protein
LIFEGCWKASEFLPQLARQGKYFLANINCQSYKRQNQSYGVLGVKVNKIFSIGLIAAIALSTAATCFAAEGPARILFDEGHNQRFGITEKGELQLSRLAEIMRDHGAGVSSLKTPLSDETLKDTAALVISGPFAALKPEEIDAVVQFIKRGGRLAVMLHIGVPLTGLLAALDLDHSNAVLHERTNVIDSDNNFRVTDLSLSPLFSGLTEFSVYGVWALDPGKSGIVLAKTSPTAWVDLDGNKVLSKGDVVGAFAVAVSGTLGAGSFVVFGDDALFQNRYLDENNSKLAANLSTWMVGK